MYKNGGEGRRNIHSVEVPFGMIQGIGNIFRSPPPPPQLLMMLSLFLIIDQLCRQCAVVASEDKI